jgi:hypothetical protein
MLYVHEGKAFQTTAKNDLTKIPMEVESVFLKEPPSTEWSGIKITFKLWQSILSWMRHTNEKFKSEAMLWLYYSRTDGWIAVPPPQFVGTGMTVKTIPDTNPAHAQKMAILNANFNRKGYLLFGTIHHHCTAAAFQSSVDANDEKSIPGFHMTVGNVTSDLVSLHARYSDTGQFHHVSLANLIGTPFDELPPNKAYLPFINGLISVNSTAEFPTWWDDMCMKQEHTPITSYGSNYKRYGYGSEWIDENSSFSTSPSLFPTDYPERDFSASLETLVKGAARENVFEAQEEDETLPFFNATIQELMASWNGLSMETAESIAVLFDGKKGTFDPKKLTPELRKYVHKMMLPFHEKAKELKDTFAPGKSTLDLDYYSTYFAREQRALIRKVLSTSPKGQMTISNWVFGSCLLTAQWDFDADFLNAEESESIRMGTLIAALVFTKLLEHEQW